MHIDWFFFLVPVILRLLDLFILGFRTLRTHVFECEADIILQLSLQKMHICALFVSVASSFWITPYLCSEGSALWISYSSYELAVYYQSMVELFEWHIELRVVRMFPNVDAEVVSIARMPLICVLTLRPEVEAMLCGPCSTSLVTTSWRLLHLLMIHPSINCRYRTYSSIVS